MRLSYNVLLLVAEDLLLYDSDLESDLECITPPVPLTGRLRARARAAMPGVGSSSLGV